MSSSSNLGKWDQWYAHIDQEVMSAFRYADTVTYLMAAAFLVDMQNVEDWGCGTGGFKRFYQGNYVGVDGSRTPFADKIVDLCDYESSTDGIVIRHVLEHNYQWETILRAAVRSFNKKLCLILFTPFADTTQEIAHNRQHGVDVPDISFCREDIESKFGSHRWELFDNITTSSGYGIEHVYFVWKRSEYAEGRASLKSLYTSVFDMLNRRYRWTRTDAAPSVRTMPKRALYTAIFGSYDELKDIPKQTDVDLICFTDDRTLRHPQWQIRHAEPTYTHPRLSAKYYKTLPHIVLAEYDETLWVDASFQVLKAEFARDVFAYLQDASIALFLHPERGCIYDEAEVSKPMAKYQQQNIAGQVMHYREQGFPEKAGLFAGGIMARRNNDPAIRRFNEMWMEHNEKWTYQDQLSLSYLFWKLDIRPAIFRQYLWNSQWGVWRPHAHDL